MAHPLARIIDQLKREPSRTGSIVITVFGDAIVPRGGSVWLGTLLRFFETLDIDSSVVRTAMSRLAADGWFEREKVGRNSFYRLVQRERQTFDIATRHIYGAPTSDWTGRFELLLIHHYRRVVLRDPLLPTALLPKDWPGRAAREICGEIYRRLLGASEQWLDRHGTNGAGPLPKAGAELRRRFAQG